MELERVLETAKLAVKRAAAAALPHWRSELRVEIKEDRSPVTRADKAAEKAILDTLTEAFPDWGILAEESGLHEARDPRYRWIVDPLDGTRGFIRGRPFWGPLVALEAEGEIVAGALALPALGDLYAAGRGLGCYRDDVRVTVSRVRELSQATVMVGEIGALLRSEHGAGVRALIDGAASTRCFGDLAGGAAVVAGEADVWIEAGVAVWDLAPHKILVEEAGGRFTDLGGAPTIGSGHAVATNGPLHDEILRLLARGPERP